MAFIYYVTQIQLDFGAVKLLKQECERIGITRPPLSTYEIELRLKAFKEALEEREREYQRTGK